MNESGPVVAAAFEILEQIAEGYLVLDLQGRLLFANRRADACLDSVEVRIGMPAAELFEDCERFLDLLRLGSGSAEPVVGKVKSAGADGDEIVLEINRALVGRQYFLLVHCVKAIKANRNFAQINEALSVQSRTFLERWAAERTQAEQSKMAVRSLEQSRQKSIVQVAAVMAHELNQPLTAVANYVNASKQELINAGASISSDISQFMNDAVAEAQRAGELVRQLKRFVESDELELATIEINELVETAVRLVVSMANDSSVQLRFRFDPTAGRILVDKIQIEQVIHNLVRNSIEAMEGRLEKTLDVSTVRCEDAVDIVICDSGPGFPKDMRDSIFEPFRSTKSGGSGIGLSLCRTIVEAHGGEIGTRPVSNGACLVVSLPVVSHAFHTAVD